MCIYAQRCTAQAILFKCSICFVAGASLRNQCLCKKLWRAGWLFRTTATVTNQLSGEQAGEAHPKTTSWAFARDFQGVSDAFVGFRLPNVVWNYLANLKAQPPSWGHWQIAPGLGPGKLPRAGATGRLPPRGAME